MVAKRRLPGIWTWVAHGVVLSVFGVVVLSDVVQKWDQYRAVGHGIHGTVTVRTCDEERDDGSITGYSCQGRFDSDSATLHISNVTIDVDARPGELASGWVSGADSEQVWPGGAHDRSRSFVGSLLVWPPPLLFGLFMMLIGFPLIRASWRRLAPAGLKMPVAEFHDAMGDRYYVSIRASKITSVSNVAKSLRQIGVIAQHRGDHAAAAENYQRAFTIFEKIRNRAGMASTLHRLGAVADLRGDHAAAMENYQRSLTIDKEIGNQAGAASTLHQIGAIAHLTNVRPGIKKLI